MKKKWKKAIITCRNEKEASPVIIVSDAAVSTRGTVEGKLVPLLILDVSTRPDIEELVRVHSKQPHGDVAVQWVQFLDEKGKIALYLSFKRPVELNIILQFEIVRQGIIIDQILTSKALYIQPGKDGDRLTYTIDNPRLLLEIPDTGFSHEWERIFFKHIAADMREKGLKRQQAKQAAREAINDLRKLGRLRMKGF